MTTAQIAAINTSNVILGAITPAIGNRLAVQPVYAASNTDLGNEIGYVYQSNVTKQWVAVFGNVSSKKSAGSFETKENAVAVFESLATYKGLDLLNDKAMVTLFNLLRTPAIGAARNPQLLMVRTILVNRGFADLLLDAEAANARVVLA